MVVCLGKGQQRDSKGHPCLLPLMQELSNGDLQGYFGAVERLLFASVTILKSDNIILAQIRSGLYFNYF